MKENKCVCCDASIPEGCQTCRKCEVESKKTIKVKATAKIEELKKWVYKHFIGVYVGIGVAICLLMLILGIVIGQAFARPIQTSECQKQRVTANSEVTANTSEVNNIEFIFKSSYE